MTRSRWIAIRGPQTRNHARRLPASSVALAMGSPDAGDGAPALVFSEVISAQMDGTLDYSSLKRMLRVLRASHPAYPRRSRGEVLADTQTPTQAQTPEKTQAPLHTQTPVLTQRPSSLPRALSIPRSTHRLQSQTRSGLHNPASAVPCSLPLHVLSAGVKRRLQMVEDDEVEEDKENCHPSQARSVDKNNGACGTKRVRLFPSDPAQSSSAPMLPRGDLNVKYNVAG
jgi:hypothetical protein